MTRNEWIFGVIIVLVVLIFCTWLVREEVRYHYRKTQTEISRVEKKADRLKKEIKELEKKLLWWEYKE